MFNRLDLVHKSLFSSQTDEWRTPIDLYNELNKIYHFETDPCTTEDNPLGTKYFYTSKDNGLKKVWIGNVFINPPFTQIKEWVREVYNRHLLNEKFNISKNTHVMLLPARTDTKWFHDYIYNKRKVDIRFLKGRLKFGNAKNSAPFPSMVVTFMK